MPVKSGTKRVKVNSKKAENYRHPESESLMRPEVGTQAQFKKRLPPKKYRYDDSLSPALEWDGQNPARERGEATEISRRVATACQRRRVMKFTSQSATALAMGSAAGLLAG